MFSDILLCVDFDRTLTAPDSSVPTRNVEAIEYFIANGGAFTVNTGRSIPMAKYFQGRFPVSAPLILYNGSCAYDPKTDELSQVCPIDLDPDGFVAELEEKFPELLVEVQAVDAHYLTKPDRDWEIFSDNGNCAWGYNRPSKIPGPFIKLALYCDCSGHSVSSMYHITAAQKEYMARAAAYLEEKYGDFVDACVPCAGIIDIQAKGVNKGAAARRLLKELGRKILVCVGDGENDVSMLEAADLAFCPADGVVADRYEKVCPCAKGSVADVIYEKLPAVSKNNS